MNNMSAKLSSMLSECNARDDLAMKHAEVAEEAIAGWEKAEAEAVFLKQELAEALQQRAAARERINNLDGALKECMQQLRCTREEQEQRIHDAVAKTSRELEKEHIYLEERLEETSKKLAKLGMENSHLSKTLQTKEKLIENLSLYKSQAEADVDALMSRLHSKEKANASLKYNVHMLEKELEIRNKEREVNLRSADASHKQNVENTKKITKLERECQRLRLLVRKRLPGPGTLAKITSEVEMLGDGPDETSNMKLNSPLAELMVEKFGSLRSHESPTRGFISLIEQLCALGEENKTLKETITKKNDEIQSLRTIGSHMEISRTMLSHDLPLTSASEARPLDEVSCSESWASSLVSELELLRNGIPKESPSCKKVGTSDISLMDDFVEMEKLARVSMDQTCRSSDMPSHGSNITGPLETELCTNPSTTVPLMVNSIQASTTSLSSELSKSIRRIIELIEGIDRSSSTDYSSHILSEDKGSSLSYGNLKASTDYIVRVFQWKNSEIGDVLQQFLHSCNNLLNGEAYLENFVRDLGSALDWILNHCFSIQDVSSMRNTMKKHFDWDESENDSELEDLQSCPPLEAEEILISKEQSLCSPSSASLSGQNNFPIMEDIQLNLKEENRRLKQKLTNMESVQKDLEEKLQSATENMEKSMIQIRKLEESIGKLQAELETSKDSKKMMENQIGNLNAQVTDARVELNEVRQKSFSLEAELENKVKCCQELDATCLKLQLQLDGITKRAWTKRNADQEDRKFQTDWEITAASEKLAECQETISNLGKQLKALASPKDAAILDKVVFTTPAPASKNRTTNRRSSLLDQMLAEDNSKSSDFNSPETKEIICTIDDPSKPPTCPSDFPYGVYGLKNRGKSQELVLGSNEIKYNGSAAAGQALAVAYSTRCGGGVNLLRKLVMGRNRSSRKKSLTMVT